MIAFLFKIASKDLNIKEVGFFTKWTYAAKQKLGRRRAPLAAMDINLS